MSIEKVSPKYYPKVEIGRRGLALGTDFLVVWLVSSSLGGVSGFAFAFILVFVLSWLGLRVLVVANNQGQSLGRWAFDMKVLDGRGRVPDLQSLVKRELITGFGVLLVAIALNNLIANPTAILLFTPLVIDCGTALSDAQLRQALHDRYADTRIVSSQRGYSLDLKVKRIVASVSRNVRR